MFTGLIEDVGIVRSIVRRGDYTVLTIESKRIVEQVHVGDSISCDGACLTVVSCDERKFVVEASDETREKTILDNYSVGSRLNLERALSMGDRLGGHFVTGHIDGVATVDYLKPIGESLELAVSFDKTFDSLVIPKGSIAINGVSLTVNNLTDGWLAVNIIPHTAKQTTLGNLSSGKRVNIEFDMIGKYVTRAFGAEKRSGIDMQTLIESGW